MRRTLLMLLVLSVALGAGSIAAANWLPQWKFVSPLTNAVKSSVTIRYRLTLLFEKDGREATGSGVVEVQYAAVDALGMVGVQSTWRGEAVATDVPGIGRVFALQQRSPAALARSPSLIGDACGLGRPENDSVEAAAEWLRRLEREFTGSCDIAAEALPFLAYFKDPADPGSVQVFQPPALPSGLVYKSGRIERTADSPTYGKTDILLPWLAKLAGRSTPVEVHYNGETYVYYISADSFKNPRMELRDELIK